MSTATRDFADVLIEALDAQLEQQGKLAALCEAQTNAIARRDVEQVEALTRAVEGELLDGRDLERRRGEAAEGLAGSLGLTAEGITLGGLCEAVDGSLALALRRRAHALETAVARLRRASAVNQALLGTELDTIDRIVRALHGETRDTYSRGGESAPAATNVLDARA